MHQAQTLDFLNGDSASGTEHRRLLLQEIQRLKGSPFCAWNFHPITNDMLGVYILYLLASSQHLGNRGAIIPPSLVIFYRLINWYLKKSQNMPKSHSHHAADTSATLYWVLTGCQAICKALRLQQWRRQPATEGKRKKTLLGTRAKMCSFYYKMLMQQLLGLWRKDVKGSRVKAKPEADRKGGQTVASQPH